MKNRKKPIFNLSSEEQVLSDAFGKGEWQSTKDLKTEKSKAHRTAVHYFNKSIGKLECPHMRY